ncbi:MAG: hypothetical protein HYX21_00640 [Candidatus Yanofskybacteria bacterium]|nr:hypothetical protein [Candidatus Yanofskybacteria bacterium]
MAHGFDENFIETEDPVSIEPTKLNLVKPTPFEELCNRISKRNSVRDTCFTYLKDIMFAYNYMRQKLDMEWIPTNWDDINCLIKEIDKKGKRRNGFFQIGKTDFQDNLWDPENQIICPEKLAQYAKRYDRELPPNTQELLDEALKEKEEKDGN